MSPDRGAADRLSRYLDAIATDEDAQSHPLEPELATAVERLFAADDAPPPPSGLADQIWQELMGPGEAEDSVPLVAVFPPVPNGRTTIGPQLPTVPVRHAEPRHRGSSAAAYLATAALVLLALVAGLVALRGSMVLVGPDQRAIIIPATDITPERLAPSDPAADELLLRSTLEQMPPEQGQSPQFALERVHLAPGAVEQAGSQENTGVGIDLFTVESGQITVAADAPVFLLRAVAIASGSPSLVQPGTAVTMNPGDHLYAQSGVAFSRRNDGSSPATLLSFSIGAVGDIPTTTSPPDGVTYDSGLPSGQPPDIPAAPAEAAVHRRTLPPGAEIAVRDVPGLHLVFVESGDLDLIYAEAETPPPPEDVLTIPEGSGTGAFGPTPEQAVLANRGDEPLVILTASIVAKSPDVQTPEASWSDGWGTGDQMR
jgi:hypothetical protein